MCNTLNIDHVGTFYRVLGHGDTLERWNQSVHSTVHDRSLPNAWLDLYYTHGKRSATDYDLGTLHSDAVKNFLCEARKYPDLVSWNHASHTFMALPISGVSAYYIPKEAIDYAMLSEFPQTMQVVTFQGRVSGILPEAEAYIVDVLNDPTPAPVSFLEFARLHMTTNQANG